MDLCEALAIGPGDVVALVGGGGKTSALYRVGAELAARGLPVLLTGTARFTPPEHVEAPNLALVASPEALRDAVDRGPWPVTAAAGHGSKGRLLPVEPAWIDALHAQRPHLTIAVEADGSAMRPFKAPGEHEPVVPVCATLVVSVVGADIVGRPLDATHAHRPERVAALAGARLGDVVTPELVAAVFAHADGGRKGVPVGARWAVLVNKADSPERSVAAERVATLLAPHAERVVIARLKGTPPAVMVLRRGD